MDETARNTLKIAATSNIRLGIHQNDPIRESDAFDAFEEVLNLSILHDVDMLIIAGDLFEDNPPNFKTFHRCICLLKKYIFGDKRVGFHVTDTYDVASCMEGTSDDVVRAAVPDLNYANVHMNIALPIFAIFGDRDRETDERQGSAIRALHGLGLLNVFGDFQLEDRLNISPLFIHKGETQLDLFGLGYLSSDILDDGLVDVKLSFHIVNEHTSYKMFVLHQEANELRDQIVPGFMDLAVFGAETAHVDSQNMVKTYTKAIQPGSPVVTKYSYAEAVPKALQVVTLNKMTCSVRDLPLDGRFLFYKTITIDPFALLREQHMSVQTFVENRLQRELDALLSLAHDNTHRAPLIRVDAYLKQIVEEINLDRLKTWYYSRVANPHEIVSQTIDTRLLEALGDEDNYRQSDPDELALAIAAITPADA